MCRFLSALLPPLTPGTFAKPAASRHMFFKSSSVILTRTPSLELPTLTQHHSSPVSQIPEAAWQNPKASLQDEVEEKGKTDRGKDGRGAGAGNEASGPGDSLVP